MTANELTNELRWGQTEAFVNEILEHVRFACSKPPVSEHTICNTITTDIRAHCGPLWMPVAVESIEMLTNESLSNEVQRYQKSDGESLPGDRSRAEPDERQGLPARPRRIARLG